MFEDETHEASETAGEENLEELDSQVLQELLQWVKGKMADGIRTDAGKNAPPPPMEGEDPAPGDVPVPGVVEEEEEAPAGPGADKLKSLLASMKAKG